MRHIRIDPMIAKAAPVEDPRDTLAIFTFAALNLVVALAMFGVRFL